MTDLIMIALNSPGIYPFGIRQRVSFVVEDFGIGRERSIFPVEDVEGPFRSLRRINRDMVGPDRMVRNRIDKADIVEEQVIFFEEASDGGADFMCAEGVADGDK